MYARHFFHLKQIQMRHTLLFGPIFVGAAIIALFLFLLNMTQPASEEQLKSAFLLVQIGILFLMIWCQILDLFVFFDTGAREITKGFHFRIFLWDITSFALFIFAAAAICLTIMAVSWYQGAIFGSDTGLLVCRMLPDNVPQSWYQWQAASGAAIVAMLNILLTDRK